MVIRYVATTGNDTTGTGTLALPYLTITKAVSVTTAAGDSILVRTGLYRESVDLSSAANGTAVAPVTLAAYGDGEVIVDPSTKITGWARYSGNIWSVAMAALPGCVIVNDVPLREVSHGQTSGIPVVNLAGVTAGSSAWFWDSAAHILYADMGPVIGAGDANSADIIVTNRDGNQAGIWSWDRNYQIVRSMTVRGAGGIGILLYGSHNLIQSCIVKFNFGAGIFFDGDSGITESDNTVNDTSVYNNYLMNWPRGNNNLMTGGGWGGGLIFHLNLRPIVHGCTVYKNGGEGIISYGTKAAVPSGYATIENNTVYDNWSGGIYIDNQTFGLIRNNFAYYHPEDLTDLLYSGNSTWTQTYAKNLTCVGIGTGDEQGSSDSTNHYANSSDTQVYNNIIANCLFGFYDGVEGATATLWHGMKNMQIVNNTIIMRPTGYGGVTPIGMRFEDNLTPSGTNRNIGSVVANNIIYGYNTGHVITSVQASSGAGIAGVSFSNNTYFHQAASPFELSPSATQKNFDTWVSSVLETGSQLTDPQLNNPAAFLATAATSPVYDWRNGAVKRPRLPMVGASLRCSCTKVIY